MPLHTGGCHCGTVRFEFIAPSKMDVTECNCSKCAMTGYLHIFVPQEDFKITSGETDISTYTFGTHAAKHMFCRICGIKSFYIPRSHPESYSVNYNCLTPGTLEIKTRIPFDGQNWDQNISDLRAKT